MCNVRIRKCNSKSGFWQYRGYRPRYSWTFRSLQSFEPTNMGDLQTPPCSCMFRPPFGESSGSPAFKKVDKAFVISLTLALPQFSNTYSGHSDVLLPLEGFYPPSAFYIHIQGAGLRRSFDRRPPTAPSFHSSAGTILGTNLATPTVTSLRFLGRLINPTRLLGLR
jgi:hypothetical protein